MKVKIIGGAVLAVLLMAMLPSIHAVEYDTAVETQQTWIKEQLATLDIKELLAYLQNDENSESFEQLLAENGIVNCILTPLKWLANILLKVLMLPLKLAVKVIVKLLVLPVKLMSATLKLLVLPIKLLLLPLRIAMIPLVLILKIITFPFKMLDLMSFLFCPFKHPLYW